MIHNIKVGTSVLVLFVIIKCKTNKIILNQIDYFGNS